MAVARSGNLSRAAAVCGYAGEKARAITSRYRPSPAAGLILPMVNEYARDRIGVQDGAAFLHAAVVPATNDLIAVHDHRADGNAAFRKSLPGLCNSGLEKLVFRTHRKNLTTEIAGIAGIAKIAKIGFRPYIQSWQYRRSWQFAIRSSAACVC